MGALINGILIIAGAIIGQLIGKYLKEEHCNQLYQAMGLAVLYIAISSMLKMHSTLNLLISRAVGTLIGSIIDFDNKIVNLGNKLQKKMSSKSPIAVGFINATLLFCVGGMAIIGAFDEGLSSDYSVLIMKGVIDGVAAIVFTAQYGIGVYFSAILVIIYEELLTVFALIIAPVLTEYAIEQLAAVGGVVLLAVGLNMCGISKFKAMNMVPAIFVSALLAVLFTAI